MKKKILVAFLIPISLITWASFLSIQIPLFLLGHLIIPFLALFKMYYVRKSHYYNKQIAAFFWPFNYIWGNEEDGVLAGHQYKDYKDDDWQVWYWSAVRNPTNNLRFIPILSCRVDPNLIDWVGSLPESASPKAYDMKTALWYYCWQGLYTNFYWQFYLKDDLYRFWIGWKLYPADILGVTEYRKYGAGFAVQFKRVR